MRLRCGHAKAAAALVFAWAAGCGHARAPLPPALTDRPEVRAFAADVALRRDLDRHWVLSQLRQAHVVPAVQRLIVPPAAGPARQWTSYRDRLVEPRRVAAGVAFWDQHAELLQRAEERFGVPAEIVVGIIGVETFYGQVTGRFRVLDALATLAFDFPPGRRDRSGFFRDELEEFLVLLKREGWKADEPRGSFAGAIGLPQFMPGSINRHAVDFDGDGRIDLRASAADAVGSVARFLQAHGWRPGLPTHHPVQPPLDAAEAARLLAPDIVPSFTVEQFLAAGAVLDDAGRQHAGLLALVRVDDAEGAAHHVAGTENFFALTRYNRSSTYALAVIALGEAVRAARTRPAGAAGR